MLLGDVAQPATTDSPPVRVELCNHAMSRLNSEHTDQGTAAKSPRIAAQLDIITVTHLSPQPVGILAVAHDASLGCGHQVRLQGARTPLLTLQGSVNHNQVQKHGCMLLSWKVSGWVLHPVSCLLHTVKSLTWTYSPCHAREGILAVRLSRPQP
mgnify:CR=1 FL=1